MSNAPSPSGSAGPGAPAGVALVHASEAMREGLALLVGRCPGFGPVLVCASAAELMKACQGGLVAELALVDLDLPDHNGHVLLSWLREQRPALRAVGVAAAPTVQAVRLALQAGARGVVPATADRAEWERALRQARAGGYLGNALTRAQLAAREAPRPDARQQLQQALATLSPQEHAVLRLRCGQRRHTKLQAARVLGLSVHTVDSYQRRACEKLGVKGAVELLLRLRDAGLQPR